MKWRAFSVLMVGFWALSSCKTAPHDNSAALDSGVSSSNDTFEDEDSNSSLSQMSLLSRLTQLSKPLALLRSKQVGQISYHLWFKLDADREKFEGKTTLLFNLKPKAFELAKTISKTVTLDFEEGEIQSLILNGQTLASSETSNTRRFDGHHLFFPLSELKPGTNRIEISYTHAYSTDGNGLHRFKDPADGKVYVYSNFEPYSAHRMFPCFDQPDLKATYELIVEAPREWQVISNTRERQITPVDESKSPKEPKGAQGLKRWIFPPTASFSTYLFALHAGPYSVWKSNHTDKIPLRLFARKSLASYVDSREWLDITQKGLDFYSTQFGLPYPFLKYDQILVPDFNAGAMENVGAVTFSERFIYRTRVTQDRRQHRANVILHEMAHMWFGDLVTMKWWNGLWLNESFATFMAAWAVDQATNFPGSWLSFFTGEKQWAYGEDQLVTTHPIEVPVPDTDHARANFDGITYGKGASVLKQLYFYLGEDDFREGLQRYFQKYAFRNTNLNDFTKMLAQASGRDLNSWQRFWLQTTGVNTLQAQWQCELDPETQESKISKFDLLQGNDPRPHRTLIFMKPSGKLLTPVKPMKHDDPKQNSGPITVSYTGPITPVKEALGKPCPNFVFPNHMDYDYVKVSLDPVSLKTVEDHLSSFEDPLTRQMIWHTLWENVIDGKMKAQDYTDRVLQHAGKETNTESLSHLIATLVSSSSNHASALKFMTPELRTKYLPKTEAWIQKNLTLAPAGSDLQLVWFNAFLEVAHSTPAVQYMSHLLDGKKKLKGLVLESDRRWDLLKALARNGVSDISTRLETELKTDMTDFGLRSSIAAEAQIPSEETKKKWANAILQKTQPLAKMREAMRSFHILGQEEFTRSFVESFFTHLPKLAHSSQIEDQEYAVLFTKTMYPSLCSQDIVNQTSKLLEDNPKMQAGVIRSLKIAQQQEERCIRARELSQ